MKTCEKISNVTPREVDLILAAIKKWTESHEAEAARLKTLKRFHGHDVELHSQLAKEGRALLAKLHGGACG
jgi:hypothetical protein